MMKCSDYIKSEFPLIDDDLKQYVEGNISVFLLCNIPNFFPSFAGVLENGADDFENSEEVYDAIGEVLQEISCDKSEAEIRLECFN